MVRSNVPSLGLMLMIYNILINAYLRKISVGLRPVNGCLPEALIGNPVQVRSYPRSCNPAPEALRDVFWILQPLPYRREGRPESGKARRPAVLPLNNPRFRVKS